MDRFKKYQGTAILRIIGIACLAILTCTPFTQANSAVGGAAYCGKDVALVSGNTGEFKFPSSMGPPENWAEETRKDIYQNINRKENDYIYNIDTDEIPAKILTYAKNRVWYVFPCSALKSKNAWKAYWRNDNDAKKRIKLLKTTYEKYMDCLYEHRAELNKLNKKIIEHWCKKKTRWVPPGFESVAEGEIE